MANATFPPESPATLGAGAASANAAPADPLALALLALAATLSDERRAQRFLDLTGLDVETLRARAGDTAILVALLDFLEGHEPDLIAVAEVIGVDPGMLTRARHAL